MGQAFSFKIQGAKELARMLGELPKAMSKAVLRKALKAAAQPTMEQGQAIANVEAVQKSVVISTKLSKNQKRGHKKDRAAVEVFVGSTHPLAHLIEFGTVERVRKKSGGSTGKMTQAPFMRPAWDATKGEALDILTKEIKAELLKAASRLAKRAEKGTLGKRAVKELRGG